MSGASHAVLAGFYGDPYYTNVTLLLPGNGSNGSTTILDYSKSPQTITPNGNAQISTAQSKFGGSSIAFNGTTDSLSTPDSPNLNMGAGDFTIELWAYPTATGQTNTSNIYTKPNGSGYGGIAIVQNNGGYGVSIYSSSNGTSWNLANAASAGTMTANAWNHVAVTRSGTNLYAFVNGTLGSTTAISTAALLTTTTPLVIGRSPIIGSSFFTGYIDDLRITKGVARYTANFTPPAAAFPTS